MKTQAKMMVRLIDHDVDMRESGVALSRDDVSYLWKLQTLDG